MQKGQAIIISCKLCGREMLKWDRGPEAEDNCSFPLDGKCGLCLTKDEVQAYWKRIRGHAKFKGRRFGAFGNKHTCFWLPLEEREHDPKRFLCIHGEDNPSLTCRFSCDWVHTPRCILDSFYGILLHIPMSSSIMIIRKRINYLTLSMWSIIQWRFWGFWALLGDSEQKTENSRYFSGV